VKGFPAVGIITDPNSCVVGRSRDRPDDPNGIRRRLFEKFFGEGVLHEFLGIFCTRSDQALFISVFPCYYRFRKLTNWVALRSIESLTGILMTGSIEKIQTLPCRERPSRVISPVPTASFLPPSVDRSPEMHPPVTLHRGRFDRPANRETPDKLGLCGS
jgi:hypothetical protein